MNLLPAGTTWLDAVTLVVAIAALVLTMRRDRALGRVGLRLEASLDSGALVLSMSNSERRPVSVESAGIASTKAPVGFTTWDRINVRWSAGSAFATSDPPFPVELAAGSPAYSVRAPAWRVKGQLHPDDARWAWTRDSYGKLHYVPLSAEVAGAINAVKRRVSGPHLDDYRHPIEREIADDEDLGGGTLA